MINKQPSDAIVKNYHFPNTPESDENDFVVRPLSKMRLIDSFDGLDDECEFEKNMFNFGDYEDLPPSDRVTDRHCKNY